MANTSNSCKDLNIDTTLFQKLVEGKNISEINFNSIFINQQNWAQLNIYNLDFSQLSPEERNRYLTINFHSLNDEFNEFIDALGGINDGDGSAVWKYWKSKNVEYKDKYLEDLSEEDLLELKFELIDIFKFMLLIPIILRLNDKPLFNDINRNLSVFNNIQKPKASLYDIALNTIQIKFEILKQYDLIGRISKEEMSIHQFDQLITVIDSMFSFFTTLCMFVNVDLEELYNLFMSKENENNNRQQNNY
nr:MAG TPA: dCTP pyrophosphatase [Caudoviricetes sp.]